MFKLYILKFYSFYILTSRDRKTQPRFQSTQPRSSSLSLSVQTNKSIYFNYNYHLCATRLFVGVTVCMLANSHKVCLSSSARVIDVAHAPHEISCYNPKRKKKKCILFSDSCLRGWVFCVCVCRLAWWLFACSK